MVIGVLALANRFFTVSRAAPPKGDILWNTGESVHASVHAYTPQKILFELKGMMWL